jgi:hypothetical protein
MNLRRLARRFAVASAVLPTVLAVMIAAHYAPVVGGPVDPLRAELPALLWTAALGGACYVAAIVCCIARLLHESFPTREIEALEVCAVLTPWWVVPLAVTLQAVT